MLVQVGDRFRVGGTPLIELLLRVTSLALRNVELPLIERAQDARRVDACLRHALLTNGQCGGDHFERSARIMCGEGDTQEVRPQCLNTEVLACRVKEPALIRRSLKIWPERRALNDVANEAPCL